MEEVRRLVEEERVDINGRFFWDTPLIAGVSYGHLPIVEYLLIQGADVNGTDEGSNTALWWAVANGHIDIVHLLISWGADVDKVGNRYYTPLQNATGRLEKEAIKALLEADADPALRPRDHQARDMTWSPVLRRLIDSYNRSRCCTTIEEMEEKGL